MTTDIVFTTVNLPPAFVGQAYEAAIAYKGNASAFTAQGLGTTVNGSGLPAGLAIDTTNAGSLRITGTPTGAASTAISSGTSLAGPGAYTFCVTATDTGGAVASATNYTINLYADANDLTFQENFSVTAQADVRDGV